MKTQFFFSITLILLFLTNCQRNRINISDSSVNDIIKEYNKDIEKYQITHGNFYDMIIIEYGPLPDGILGRCRQDYIFGVKVRTLTIKRGITDKFLVKYIYYHEMGHCNFDLKHDDDGFKLMNTIINPQKVDIYKDNWEYLKHTYFTKIKKQEE